MPIEKSKKPSKKVVKPAMLEDDTGIASIAAKVDEIRSIVQPPAPPAKKEKKKRLMTEEQKAVLRERLEKARAVKKEKQAANKKIIEE